MHKCQNLYHLILQSKGFSLEHSLLNTSTGYVNLTLLCKKDKEEEINIPGSMILGGVEILTGALVWILPFPGTKQVAGIMIGDGIRRAFNGLEDLDEANK